MCNTVYSAIDYADKVWQLIQVNVGIVFMKVLEY